jgi:hypothetical protein
LLFLPSSTTLSSTYRATVLNLLILTMGVHCFPPNSDKASLILCRSSTLWSRQANFSLRPLCVRCHQVASQSPALGVLETLSQYVSLTKALKDWFPFLALTFHAEFF